MALVVERCTHKECLILILCRHEVSYDSNIIGINPVKWNAIMIIFPVGNEYFSVLPAGNPKRNYAYLQCLFSCHCQTHKYTSPKQTIGLAVLTLHHVTIIRLLHLWSDIVTNTCSFTSMSVSHHVYSSCIRNPYHVYN